MYTSSKIINTIHLTLAPHTSSLLTLHRQVPKTMAKQQNKVFEVAWQQKRPTVAIDISLQDHISNPELLEHIKQVGKVFYQREYTNSN